ncbi:MAG: hypothetical protein JXQ87_07110 [Bacteroidia bacterium]
MIIRLQLLISIIVSSIGTVQGQNDTLKTNNASLTKGIVISSDVHYSSTFLSANEMYGFIQKPVLSSSLFQEMLLGASMVNSLLYTDEHRLQYQLPLKQNFALAIGIFNNNLLHTNIDYDVLGLLAYGNSVYKGETAFVNNSSLTYLTQTGFSIGASKLINYNRISILLKPSLNVFQSGSFVNLSAINSSLFTEENAEYLTLVYNYDFALQTSPTPFTGTGFSGDILAELYFSNGSSTIEFGIKDFGLTFYKNETFQAGAKSGDISYSGVELEYNDLSSLGGRNIDSETDSLLSILTPQNIANQFTFYQPLRLVFNASIMGGEKDRFRFNMFYLPNYSKEPVFNLIYSRYLGQKVTSGLNIGNGAFGGLSSGVNFGYNSSKVSLECTINGILQLNNSIHAQSGGLLKFAYKFD